MGAMEIKCFPIIQITLINELDHNWTILVKYLFVHVPSFDANRQSE